MGESFSPRRDSGAQELGDRFLARAVKVLCQTMQKTPAMGEMVDFSKESIQIVQKEWSEEQKSLGPAQRIQQLEQAANCSVQRDKEITSSMLKNITGIAAQQKEAVMDLMAAMPSQIRHHTQTAMLYAHRGIGNSQALLPVTGPLDSQAAVQFYMRLLPMRRPQYKEGDLVPNCQGYVFDQLLGLAGFGEVWKVRHPTLTFAPFVIKLCADQDSKKIIQREAIIFSQLQAMKHPHIVQLLGVNLQTEPYWLALEYVEGGTLEDFIRVFDRPIPLDQALRIFIPICQGIKAAHDAGIIHRDLKPANILMTTDGSPKIADFGIGKIMAQKTTKATTTTFTTRGYGTPLYMSPEQQDAALPAHPSDDVYALGVILFQMLMGNCDRSVAYLQRDLAKLGLPIPREIQDLLRDCISLPREERPAHAGAMLQRLQTGSVVQLTSEAVKLAPQAVKLTPQVQPPVQKTMPPAAWQQRQARGNSGANKVILVLLCELSGVLLGISIGMLLGDCISNATFKSSGRIFYDEGSFALIGGLTGMLIGGLTGRWNDLFTNPAANNVEIFGMFIGMFIGGLSGVAIGGLSGRAIGCYCGGFIGIVIGGFIGWSIGSSFTKKSYQYKNYLIIGWVIGVGIGWVIGVGIDSGFVALIGMFIGGKIGVVISTKMFSSPTKKS